MFAIVFLGATTAIGGFVLTMLAPIRRDLVLKYCWVFDVAFSLGVIVAYAGTFSGVATAFVAGLTYSGLLRLTRWWHGCER